MKKHDDISWADFGFPTPGFMPIWKPAEGLMKALAERKLPFAKKWDFESIVQQDQLKQFEAVSAQRWCREFDYLLSQTAAKYLNHTQTGSGVMWNLEDLLLFSVNGDKKQISDPAKGDLSGEWNLQWLMQRYRAVNLLRYAAVPHRYDYITGSVHTGKPSSVRESIDKALSTAVRASASGLPAAYVHNIYGPDHGWRENSYCCDIVVAKSIYAQLPENLSECSNIVLYLKVTGADGSADSFKGGGKISVGDNYFIADENGVFVEFGYSESELAAFAGIPRRDHETFGGWQATVCQAYADYSEVFHFTEKEGSS